MPEGGKRAIASFLERFRNSEVVVPKSLQSEPPDIIYTGLMEQEEMRAPELMEFMPSMPMEEQVATDPLAADPLAAGLPAEDDPFGDIPLEDVLNY